MEQGPAPPETIRQHTEKLLRRADATDRWPTRVNDILEASKLEEVPESPLAATVLRRAPEHLRHAVRLLKTGKVRAILDRRARVVHIDPHIDNEGRRHFVALHEVTHDLLPWQRELGYADDDMTLSDRARRAFEREANQGAAEMFFQGLRFTAIAANFEIGMDAVSALHEQSGASLRATLRRYAETHRRPLCAIAMEPSPCQVAPLGYRRLEVSQSAAWTARFGETWPRRLTADAFPFLICARDPQQRDFVWPDLDSEPVAVQAEVIKTPYSTLLLLWVARRQRLKRKVCVTRRAA
jgi:hypothetical protein